MSASTYAPGSTVDDGDLLYLAVSEPASGGFDPAAPALDILCTPDGVEIVSGAAKLAAAAASAAALLLAAY